MLRSLETNGIKCHSSSSKLYGQKGLNIKEAANKQPDVQRQGNTQMTHGLDTDENATWVSEGNDSPGAVAVYSCLCVKQSSPTAPLGVQ